MEDLKTCRFAIQLKICKFKVWNDSP